jgi:hypothetical protein
MEVPIETFGAGTNGARDRRLTSAPTRRVDDEQEVYIAREGCFGYGTS